MNIQQIGSIVFNSDEEGYASVRIGDKHIALSLSLKSNGDH